MNIALIGAGNIGGAALQCRRVSKECRNNDALDQLRK
jgi:hypothetical protein